MSITGATTLLGLIGDPVAQARTPGMANDVLQRAGLFGRYALLPMHVRPEGLQAAVAGWRALENFGGAVVTMPHKTAMARLVDVLTAEAEVIGAVNVVRREPGGRLVGTVLDGEGFVAGLRAAGHDVADRRIVLVGAGGAASAIAFSLAKHGCRSLTLLNRTPDKAAALAARLAATFPTTRVDTRWLEADAVDIAINGTSLGMQPGDALPMPDALIDRAGLVAECVIAPEMTALLQRAQARGRPIHTGVPMLAGQVRLMLQFMGVELPSPAA